MYKIILFLALISLAKSAAIGKTSDAAPVTTLKSNFDVEPDGSYVYSYELSDGSYKEEKGTTFNAGTDDAYVALTGLYRFIDEEGQTQEVHYTADRNGFVPRGTGIPESISIAAEEASAANAAQHK